MAKKVSGGGKSEKEVKNDGREKSREIFKGSDHKSKAEDNWSQFSIHI